MVYARLLFVFYSSQPIEMKQRNLKATYVCYLHTPSVSKLVTHFVTPFQQIPRNKRETGSTIALFPHPLFFACFASRPAGRRQKNETCNCIANKEGGREGHFHQMT